MSVLAQVAQVIPTDDPPAWLDSLGPFIAYGALSLLVIVGLARALVTALKENRETTDRVFQVVETALPVLAQVKDVTERATKATEAATRELERRDRAL